MMLAIENGIVCTPYNENDNVCFVREMRESILRVLHFLNHYSQCFCPAQYLTGCCGPEVCEAWLAVLVAWAASVVVEARGREEEGRGGRGGEEGRVGGR